MNEKKAELIAKLEKIRELRIKVRDIEREIDDVEPKDNYPRQIKVPQFPVSGLIESNTHFDHTRKDAKSICVGRFEKIYGPHHPQKPDYGTPPQPPKPPEPSKLPEPPKPPKPIKASDLLIGYDGGRLLNICYLIGAFLLFISLGSTALEPINFKFYWFFILVSLLLIAPRLIKAIKHNLLEQEAYKAELDEHNKQLDEFNDKHNKQLDEHNKKLDEYNKQLDEYNKQKAIKEEKYNKKLKEYEEQCEEFKSKRSNFIKEYTEWRELYLASVQEEEEIQSQLAKDKEQLKDKLRKEELTPAIKELENFNDLVADDYLPCLSEIIDILEKGRADDYKEALNVLEDDNYKAEQLSLQKEQEESRKKEAQRQHKEQMELIKSQEERRVRDEERRREHEEWRREQAADDRCRHCMHSRTCPLKGKAAATDCTGFTPYRSDY